MVIRHVHHPRTRTPPTHLHRILEHYPHTNSARPRIPSHTTTARTPTSPNHELLNPNRTKKYRLRKALFLSHSNATVISITGTHRKNAHINETHRHDTKTAHNLSILPHTHNRPQPNAANVLSLIRTTIPSIHRHRDTLNPRPWKLQTLRHHERTVTLRARRTTYIESANKTKFHNLTG